MTDALTRVALAALLIASPLAAQKHRDPDEDEDYRSRIDTTVTIDKTGTVDLSLTSGEIIVKSWDKGSVQVRAWSERGLLRLDASSARVSLSVRSERGGMGDTHYEVTIPAGARLSTHSVSGDITTTGGSEVEARSVSGDITTETVSGRATLESVSGTVKATSVKGGIRANAVSGDVILEDITGEVDAQTVSGEIDLRSINSSYISTETVSGDLTFDGKVDPKGRYEFHAHSGDIRISLPSGLPGATFSVETFSGEIDSRCRMTLQPSQEHGHKRLEFTLGNGGPRFTIETFSGDVRIDGCPGSSRSDR
jgi:DUF4097 and DUF4098 domain-containing protein YvlB